MQTLTLILILKILCFNLTQTSAINSKASQNAKITV